MVLEMGLAPDYVLDRMEMYEVHALMEHQHLRNKAQWEQARFIGYVSANCAGAKLKEFSDLVKFPWEKVDKEIYEAPTEEQRKELESKAEYFAGLLNKEK